MNSGKIGGRMRSGALLIDQILKGSSDLRSVTFEFVVTDVFVGYPGTAVGDYRIFFLKSRNSGYEFASPYYPSIPAVAGMPAGSGNIVERIVRAQAEVVQSRDVSAGVKREAIHVLQKTDGKSPLAVAAFRSALSESNQSVRLSAAAALVAADDAGGLRVAELALLQARPEMPAEGLQGLRAAISLELNVGPESIQTIARLLAQGDVPTRQAASRALRRARSADSLQLLEAALDDRRGRGVQRGR